MNPNIALLSTAHIHTKSFIENFLKAGDGRRISAIWDDVPDRGRRYAESARAPFETDLDKVVQDPATDGFIICAENTRHLPLLEKVLPIGKPVFCEKPLVTSRTDLDRVRTLLQQHPTPLFCGYFQPFSAEMDTIRRRIHQGDLGRVTRFRYRNAHHAAYGRWFDNPDLAWFTDPQLAGGGAFMDMGTHAIHLARSLFGPVREVFAQIENHSGAYPAVDDYGIAQFRFTSGILGTVEAGWTQTGGIGGLEVVGSEKTLWHNGSHYVIGAPGQATETLDPGTAQPTRVDRLIALLRGEITREAMQTDLENILDTVALMEACYTASEEKRWVALS